MKYRYLRYPGFLTKAVTFSYDDGNEHDPELIRILNRHGFKATFNIPGCREGGGIGAPHRISDEDAKALIFPNGHDVAIHCAHHTAPVLSEPKDAIREVLDNRSYLEEYFGCLVRGMAYPDRTEVNNGVIETYLTMLGVTFARIGGCSHSFALPTNWLEWQPTTRNVDPAMLEWADKFLAKDPTSEYVSHRESLLFSVWGHSFEFPRDNNWDVMDKLGEKLGHRDDIWYCTNNELYDYCHAYDSLIFSCDNTFVYNPTTTPVYFEATTKNYLVEPGKTLALD